MAEPAAVQRSGLTRLCLLFNRIALVVRQVHKGTSFAAVRAIFFVLVAVVYDFVFVKYFHTHIAAHKPMIADLVVFTHVSNLPVCSALAITVLYKGGGKQRDGFSPFKHFIRFIGAGALLRP